MLENLIKSWGLELGLDQIAISDCNLEAFADNFINKVKSGMFGDMSYMERNLAKRLNPEQLVANTKSIITASMDYFPENAVPAATILTNPNLAYISRYALGRDYHKIFRKKLKQLAEKIRLEFNHNYRVFTDSAPVMELALAQKSGLGWLGKNSCIIAKDHGSWFFLGEIYTDLELMPNKATTTHCGTCTACIDTCPTNAFVKPYLLDPRKCISYLTIEHRGAIPEKLRELIGNRIYGCDDCQLYCPWNKFSRHMVTKEFNARDRLDNISLLELWNWTYEDFHNKLQGSPIKRIGFEKWQRNLAVALGNAKPHVTIVRSLKNCQTDSSMVQEHINWALANLAKKARLVI